MIVYERHDSMKATRVDPTREFANRFGVFRMAVCSPNLASLHYLWATCDMTANYFAGLGRPALWHSRACKGTRQGLGVSLETEP